MEVLLFIRDSKILKNFGIYILKNLRILQYKNMYSLALKNTK